MGFFKKDEAETARIDMAKAIQRILAERGLDSVDGKENRKSLDDAVMEGWILEALGHIR